MAVNALTASGYRGARRLTSAVTRLYDARFEEEGGQVYWRPNGDTMVGSWGDAADDRDDGARGSGAPPRAGVPGDGGGRHHLARGKKDPQGNWGYSTQATVLTLKLLLESLSGNAGATDALIAVRIRTAMRWAAQFDDFNSDVLWQVDLSPLVAEGDERRRAPLQRRGNLMYQVTATHYLPYEGERAGAGRAHRHRRGLRPHELAGGRHRDRDRDGDEPRPGPPRG
jgi:hypothetical protein